MVRCRATTPSPHGTAVVGGRCAAGELGAGWQRHGAGRGFRSAAALPVEQHLIPWPGQTTGDSAISETNQLCAAPNRGGEVVLKK